MMRAAALFALLLASACTHREPRLPPPETDEEREAAELEQKQREYFEEYHTARTRDCPRRCTLASAVCHKARRICEISEANPRDEGLVPYCSAASTRCEKADHRLRGECACFSSGPRVD